MFAFKVATILAVVATAMAVPTPGGSGSCSTGTLQCCDSISPAGGSNNETLGGLLPVGLQDLNLPIGLNCLPINVLGLGSSGTCNSQAACCNGVTNNGPVLFGLNCSPVNVGL